MESWAFPSKNTGTPEAPVYDRPITHLMERAVTRAKYTNGIFVTKLDAEQNAFKVTSLGTMNVVVKPGICHINGALGWQDTDFDVTISPAHATLNRKDIIVLRLDDTEDVRAIEIIKKEGTPSSVPTAPALIRQDNIYEIEIAEITINAKVEGIMGADIKDTRLDNDVCGLVIPAIPTPFDTKALYTQIEEDLKLFKETYEAEFTTWSTERKAEFERWFADRENEFNEWYSTKQTEFDEWFERMKGQLSTDAAGNLQRQIDALVQKDIELDGKDKELDTNKMNVPIPTEYTMQQSKWSGNVYSFESDYPFDQYTVYVLGATENTTTEQKNALDDADLRTVLTNQTVVAKDITPTIDILVGLEVVKKNVNS